jgi:hypothetical protein|tara:strand:- start:365 stop:529 length:165 start_codon:yes stop_codon:yes gene_type:complete
VKLVVLVELAAADQVMVEVQEIHHQQLQHKELQEELHTQIQVTLIEAAVAEEPL